METSVIDLCGSETTTRKIDHLRINLEEHVQFRGLTTGLEMLYLPHAALPELDLQAVNTTQRLFGKQLNSPLLISSMTGGTPWGREINRALAEAAQIRGIALGLGSMRAALEHPALLSTFAVRDVAPDILLLANLGAVQLNYGYTAEHCRRLVEMVQADVLVLHLNALQEAVQAEGNTNFSGLLSKIETVVRELAKDQIPVVVKEVGWGFSQETSRLLAQTGIAAIDASGAGGTSWSEVERYRAPTPAHRQVASAFINWGIPTVQSIRNVRTGAPTLLVFASGGIRTGIDVAKCIALGSSLVGMASPFLKAAVVSTEAVLQCIDNILWELRIAMFCCGASNLETLAKTPLLCRGALYGFGRAVHCQCAGTGPLGTAPAESETAHALDPTARQWPWAAV